MTTAIAGAAAYANMAKLSGAGLAASDGAGGFGDLVKSALEGAVGTVQSGETASLAALAGKANLADVVAAVSSAELTVQSVVAIRDRVITAYQSILQMPI